MIAGSIGSLQSAIAALPARIRFAQVPMTCDGLPPYEEFKIQFFRHVQGASRPPIPALNLRTSNECHRDRSLMSNISIRRVAVMLDPHYFNRAPQTARIQHCAAYPSPHSSGIAAGGAK